MNIAEFLLLPKILPQRFLDGAILIGQPIRGNDLFGFDPLGRDLTFSN